METILNWKRNLSEQLQNLFERKFCWEFKRELMVKFCGGELNGKKYSFKTKGILEAGNANY